MAKIKTKNSHTPLVFIAYVLFALLIVSIILSTLIPFGGLLFTPRVLYWNVILLTVFLVVGAILPVLIGYFVGDQSVKSKSKLTHHFNGVLFGLLAYWMMTIVSMIMSIQSDYFMQSPNWGVIIQNVVPSAVIALVTCSLAVAHVRGRQARQDILDYKPYSALLITLTLLAPVIWSLPGIFLNQDYSLYPIVQLVITLIIGAVSFISLQKTAMSLYSKIVWSAVSITVAYVAVYVFLQLIPSVSNYFVQISSIQQQDIENILGWALAFICWIVYWIFQVRFLTAKK